VANRKTLNWMGRVIMPKVGKKKFPYSEAGVRAAKTYAKRVRKKYAPPKKTKKSSY